MQHKSHVCTRQRHTTARDRSTKTCVTHGNGHALHATLAQEKGKRTCQSGLNGARAWTCTWCAQIFVLATTATGEGARANFCGADRGEDCCCATATNRRSGSSCASTQRVMKITPCVRRTHDLLNCCGFCRGMCAGTGRETVLSGALTWCMRLMLPGLHAQFQRSQQNQLPPGVSTRAISWGCVFFFFCEGVNRRTAPVRCIRETRQNRRHSHAFGSRRLVRVLNFCQTLAIDIVSTSV